jgi:hypothetical protein
MAKATMTQLQNWCKTLVDDEACMEEVRRRFQLRMLEKFRMADKEKREAINAIMDNEVMFFDELKMIAAEVGDINAGDEEVNT